MCADDRVIIVFAKKFIKRLTAPDNQLVDEGFLSVAGRMVLFKSVAYAEKLRQLSVYKYMALADYFGFFGRPKGESVFYIAGYVLCGEIFFYCPCR